MNNEKNINKLEQALHYGAGKEIGETIGAMVKVAEDNLGRKVIGPHLEDRLVNLFKTEYCEPGDSIKDRQLTAFIERKIKELNYEHM